jgi:hypothetical protein
VVAETVDQKVELQPEAEVQEGIEILMLQKHLEEALQQNLT